MSQLTPSQPDPPDTWMETAHLPIPGQAAASPTQSFCFFLFSTAAPHQSLLQYLKMADLETLTSPDPNRTLGPETVWKQIPEF
jgi:hypothetical protein